MIDLKDVIAKYPQCLESPEKFRSFMLDLYPDNANQARIKVLADVMRCGIVDEIKLGKTDSLAIQNYRTNMEKKYGYSSRLVMESIMHWVRAFEKEEDIKAEASAKTDNTANRTIGTNDKMHTHKYNETIIPSNCREKGYTLHKCDCGYEYKDKFTPIGAHIFEIVDSVEPTCLEEGRKDYLCSVCSEYKSESVPKVPHKMGEWKTITEPTCEKDGKRERKCVTCDKTETESIPRLGHSWSKWAEQVHPTCTENGKEARQCKKCEKIEEHIINATGHKWSSMQASSTQDDMWEYYCKNCGETKNCNCNPNDFEIENGELKKYVGHSKKVTIPDSVTSIGFQAFWNCSGITSITIPDSVTSIGNSTFYGCSGLTNVTIGNSVKSIGEWAFFGCSGLTSVSVDSNNQYYYSSGNCLIEKSTNTLICGCKNSVIPDSVTSIGSGAFYDCSDLTSITIPDSVTSIGKSAFGGCTGLTSITIPNNVTSIGFLAFFRCCGLTSITIPDSVTSIGNSTFYGCSGLKSITIPNSVTSIGDEAFKGCDSLTSITIPNSVTSIGKAAFDSCNELQYNTYGNAIYLGNSTNPYVALIEATSESITSCKINNSTKVIANSAFSLCKGLTSITIPNSVTSIGHWVFYGCSGLTSITIPDSVTSIGSYAFEYCTGLTSVTIPDSVTSIGNEVFRGCACLISIVIPDSVKSIDYCAFDGCDNLRYNTYNNAKYLGNSTNPYVALIEATSTSITSCYIHNNTKVIAGSAFSGCSNLQFNVYDNAKYLGNSTNPYVALIEATSESITSCNIHNNTKVIYNYAFRNCNGLTSITIPDGIISIGRSAFDWCNRLTSITIGNIVTSIGEDAFSECSHLTNITIGTGITDVNWLLECKELNTIFTVNPVVKMFAQNNAIKCFASPEELEAERKAHEEAERKACEEVERKAREEAERKAREEAERKAREEAERKAREENEKLQRRNSNLCQYCGGEFKGLFKKVCAKCGKPKDY